MRENDEEQMNEILRLLQETRAYAMEANENSAAHLLIAQEYKKNLGDPIEKAKFVGKVIKWIVISTVSAILTFSALAEWWGGFISKWVKH